MTKASESTNARFKRKKIRSMKRDFDKINEKLKESEKKLESVGPESHSERISNLIKFSNKYDWSGLGFPVSFKDISKFNKKISINLLTIEDKEIYICRKGGNYKRTINLMTISESNRKHYVAIKSLSRLLSSKNTKHKGKEYFCKNCLQGFQRRAFRLLYK